MKVVSDATPLIALARIGHFDLLKLLFGDVMITPEVRDEVVGAGDLPGTEATRASPWISVRPIQNLAGPQR